MNHREAIKRPLPPLLAQELNNLGQWLRALRLKRKITIASMCERIGVRNPRTVSKIERGDPTVSLGTFIEYLNILGLANQLPERLLGEDLKIVSEQKPKHVFRDEEMDF